MMTTTLVNRQPKPRQMGRGQKSDPKGKRLGIQFDQTDVDRTNEIQQIRLEQSGTRFGPTQLVREALWCYLKDLRKGSRK